MAHAQKPDFVFRQNGRVHLNRQGRQFSRLLADEVCTSTVVLLNTPSSQVVWRVLATHSTCHFPPSLPLPCVTVCQHISTELLTALPSWRVKSICCWTVQKVLEMVSIDSQTRVSYLADRISLQADWLQLLCNVMPTCKCVWWMCRTQLHGYMGRNHATLRRHLRCMTPTFRPEHGERVASTASYLGSFEFKSGPGDWLSRLRLFVVFCAVFPGCYQESS